MIQLYEPLEGVASAQGLDVSNFQGQFDWAGNASGLAFGICRVTQGLGGKGLNSPDPEAAWNFSQMAANGLLRGAYHFLDPRVSGAAQAQYFADEVKRLGVTTSDMLFMDTETKGSTPAITAACGLQFMLELKRLFPSNPIGVYTYIDFAKEGNCAGLGAYPLWLAYPAASAPVQPLPWLAPEFMFWQWGTRNGDDADAFMGTAAELQTWVASFSKHDAPAPLTMSQTPYPTYVDLGWGAVPGAATYHYQVLADHGMKVVGDAMTTATHAKVTGLSPNTGYAWRVSVTPDGLWSVERSFTTPKAPKPKGFWARVFGGA